MNPTSYTSFEVKAEQLLLKATEIKSSPNYHNNLPPKIKKFEDLLNLENFLKIVTYIEQNKHFVSSHFFDRLRKSETQLNNTLYRVDAPTSEFFIHFNIIHAEGCIKTLTFAIAYSSLKIHVVARSILNTPSNIYSAERETFFLTHLEHPAFMQTSYISNFPSKVSDRQKQHILMEFCERDLFFAVLENQLSFEKKLTVAKQIAQGLKWLHAAKNIVCDEEITPIQGIVHQDLKLENILLTDELSVKITDFGFTATLDLLTQYPLQMKGTFANMPPELYKAYSFSFRDKEELLTATPQSPATAQQLLAIDLWSLGIIYHILFLNESPFDYLSEKLILDPLNKGSFPDILSLLQEMENFCKKFHNSSTNPLTTLIFDLLQFDFENRPSIDEVCQRLEALQEFSLEELSETLSPQPKTSPSKQTAYKLPNTYTLFRSKDSISSGSSTTTVATHFSQNLPASPVANSKRLNKSSPR